MQFGDVVNVRGDECLTETQDRIAGVMLQQEAFDRWKDMFESALTWNQVYQQFGEDGDGI